MRTFIATFLLIGIQIYRVLSKFFGMTSPCRFYPTCSLYAQQAIHLYGPFSGLRMTTGRLLRCHPWNPGGVDLPEMES